MHERSNNNDSGSNNKNLNIFMYIWKNREKENAIDRASERARYKLDRHGRQVQGRTFKCLVCSCCCCCRCHCWARKKSKGKQLE